MKFTNLLLFFCSVSLSAQIGIGTTNVNESTILNFSENTTKGIILPIVEVLPSAPANGTILMDKNDLIVKMFENNKWIAMSTEGDVSNTQFNTSNENMTAVGVTIGDTATTDGILVLESTTKALVLPKVESPEINVKSPPAGYMCYDTNSKSVAICNGKVWSFLN